MLGAMAEKQDPSGIEVYPRLPVPSGRRSEPRLPGGGGGGGGIAKLLIAVVLAAGAGAAAGYFLAPSHKGALAKTEKELADAKTAARVEADRAAGLTKRVDIVTREKQDVEDKYAVASTQLAENEKKAAEANAAAQKKLQASVDPATGEVSTEGEEIHLKLVDKVLFALGDDQLTDKGKAVLAKVGKALADMPDKQIWVQGHTDDTPIVIPPPPKKPAKPVKGAKPVETPAGPRFASNWELSAARALQVVHYLQDTAKIEPARLAALAFGQYRPVSKTNKAQNRRIEIVLYPHKAVIERAKKR
jgi:chemotaxis protein MotB